MSTPADAIEAAIVGLQLDRAALRRQLGEVEAQIKRHEAALRALNGGGDRGRHQRSATAVLAALRSYSGPVTSTTLLAHADLVHYSPSTLRAALGALHRQGLIASIERTPKGYVWAVAEDGQP